MEKIKIKGYNDLELPTVLWKPDKIKAILQITHGMTEHIERYDEFAQELNKAGILVAGFDLRGHGHHNTSEIATFEEDGWDASLEDMHIFYQYLKDLYPNTPHFILGFSLGSFLLREYLNKYNDKLNGAIIMGTGQQPSFVLSIIMMIVKTQINKAGFNNTTPLVKQLSFDTYNQKFKPNKTDFDWLCSDEKEIENYQNDNLCKKAISSGLFYQLLSSMKKVGLKNAYDHWDKELPIYLISGKEDPVGDFGKGVLKIKEEMETKFSNLTFYLFEHARHDILHEKENQTAKLATKMIIDWINKYC